MQKLLMTTAFILSATILTQNVNSAPAIKETAKTDVAKPAGKASENEMEQTGKEMEQTGKEVEEAGKDMGKSGEELEESAESMDKAEEELNKAGEDMDKAGEEANKKIEEEMESKKPGAKK